MTDPPPPAGADAARPVIGISCYVEPASWGAWRAVPAALLPYAYVSKVEQAGGIAVIIPPREDADRRLAQQTLARLDGLILAGGVDLDPAGYGAQRHPSVQDSRADRDASELWLARVSAETGIPTLGICRGMQVMAVAAGGHLEQHVPDRVGHHRHSPAPATYGRHPVRVAVHSRLAGIVGTYVEVSSYHHQAVATHPGYRATAWDTEDGTLEAMEDPHSPFRIAVQGHPEIDEDGALFSALVEAARAHRDPTPGLTGSCEPDSA
jgi:putative glutamine amidotransferase